MQGRNENILTAIDKFVAFMRKIAIWKKRMREDNLDTFSLAQKTCVTEMIPIIGAHLTCLKNKINIFSQSALKNLIGFAIRS